MLIYACEQFSYTRSKSQGDMYVWIHTFARETQNRFERLKQYVASRNLFQQPPLKCVNFFVKRLILKWYLNDKNVRV